MKNLLFNLNSVEESYGEVTLTNVVQIFERVNDIIESIAVQLPELTDFEKEELSGRLEKLMALNLKIRSELAKQEMSLHNAKDMLVPVDIVSGGKS